MKKKSFYKSFLAIAIGFVGTSSAYSQFTLTAEVRPRTEVRNGFKTPSKEAFDPAVFTEQRSRLYFDYAQPKYKMRVAFQDVRFWGETTQIFKKEVGTTFLSEAWGEVSIAPKVSVKVGRQIISYDNQRYLGGLEWAQQGRRHDALLIKSENPDKKSKFHLGLAFNSDQDIAEPGFLQRTDANFYSVGGSYKTMQYAWFHKDLEKAKVSLLAMNLGLQNADSTVSNKQTFGIIASKKAGKVTLAADLYYQTGKIGQNEVGALLAGMNATFKTKATPITIGYEFISGKDDDDATSKITNFNPDFGTNHAHNGFMDYFFVGPANGNVGVQDIYIKTKFKLGKGALMVHGHQFMTGSEQLVGTEVLGKNMGTEIDLVYAQKLNPAVTLNLGYSQMFAAETMLAIRPGDAKTNSWAWAMLTFKPVLFKSEK